MIRAVICDIYGTLLDVGPPPPDAEPRWHQLWHASITHHPAPTLTELDTAVRARVPASHAAGHATGLLQPEIDWLHLAEEAFPALRQIPAEQRPEFYYHHATLVRSITLAADAAPCLHRMTTLGIHIGIASNAQACTRLELASAFTQADLDLSLFHPQIQFWSYLEGVAKPDPLVFSTLTARLATLGIAPAETLMVGDRIDADITPARHAGWSAWLLQPTPGPLAGPWSALQRWLEIGCQIR